MKNLTKKQLNDLIFHKCSEIALSNEEQIKNIIFNNIKTSEDNFRETLVKFIIAYGSEIRRECCQTFSETLYDILYSE